MSLVLVAHQPVFMPWLGFWEKMSHADLFCVFDITQYERHSYENRNEIKTNAGKLLLTVPVESKNHLAKTIGNIRIVPGSWSRKMVKSIELAYADAPYYKQYIPSIRHFLTMGYETLAELNLQMILFGMRELGLKIPVVYASDYHFRGVKSGLVLDMCKQLGATEYWFGAQGRDYADVEAFEAAGVKPHFQNYRHPTYPQLHGEFVSHLAFIDLLFNCGPESLAVIKGRSIMSEVAA